MLDRLSYFVTVSRDHVVPAKFLLRALRPQTTAPIVVCGNLDAADAQLMRSHGADYIDENEVDLHGRFPKLAWERKHDRPVGWFKQMFLRLSIDRFMQTEQVVILDAEVFPFDNWDESRFYDPSGAPRSFYWTPLVRKPPWDYQLYRGAAKLLSALPDFAGVMDYANCDRYRRHISGVVLFSTRNIAHLWRRLETETDLEKNLDELFNGSPDLSFSDHDFYGIAVDYGMFHRVVRTVPYPGLLGWYNTHNDPVFAEFRNDAMWSMCQGYIRYPTEQDYADFMRAIAADLGCELPVLAVAA